MTERSSQQVQIEPPSTPSLWFGLLASPITWSLYFIGGYALSEAACRNNLLRGTVLGINALSGTLLLMTALTLLVILYVGWIVYQNRQRVQSTLLNNQTSKQTGGYSDFMTSVGMMLSGLTAFLTLVIGLAVPFLPMCS